MFVLPTSGFGAVEVHCTRESAGTLLRFLLSTASWRRAPHKFWCRSLVTGFERYMQLLQVGSSADWLAQHFQCFKQLARWLVRCETADRLWQVAKTKPICVGCLGLSNSLKTRTCAGVGMTGYSSGCIGPIVPIDVRFSNILLNFHCRSKLPVPCREPRT